MKKFLSLFCAGFALSLAHAEVKPNKTVLATYCGVNVFESTWVNEVCLARVQGFDKLDVLQTTDTKDRRSLGIIIDRKLVKQNNKSLKVETLTLSTGEMEKDGNYTLLVTSEATLTSRLRVVPGGGMYAEPSEITGRDANGRSFKATLQGVVHTESVGGGNE